MGMASSRGISAKAQCDMQQNTSRVLGGRSLRPPVKRVGKFRIFRFPTSPPPHKLFVIMRSIVHTDKYHKDCRVSFHLLVSTVNNLFSRHSRCRCPIHFYSPRVRQKCDRRSEK